VVEQIITEIYSDIFGAKACLGFKNFDYKIDARSLTEFSKKYPQLWSHVDILFFNCPWSVPPTNIPAMLKDFFAQVRRACSHGVIVLLGLPQHDFFFQFYDLRKIQVFVKSLGIQYLGADQELVRYLFNFGYRHESMNPNKDVHDRVMNTLKIHVFKLIKSL
jgi:hypothetical protein